MAWPFNGPAGSVGQFVIGTFTADSTSQVISFPDLPSYENLVTAYQLRDVTVVPEPSTGLLLLGGLGTLWVGRRWHARANRS